MSPTGLTQDAGWEIGVSRTLPTSLTETWDVVVDGPGLARWLGEGAVLPDEVGGPYRTDDGAEGELRSLRPLERVRLTWQPDGRAGRPPRCRSSSSRPPRAPASTSTRSTWPTPTSASASGPTGRPPSTASPRCSAPRSRLLAGLPEVLLDVVGLEARLDLLGGDLGDAGVGLEDGAG
jgi:uncharacterized protein YndB with AHSA1/START domain